MGVIERVATSVSASGSRIDRRTVNSIVSSALAVEAPFAGPDVHQGVVDLLVGLGPVESLLRLPGVTDVFVNGASEIWMDRNGQLELSQEAFPDDASILAAIERVITPVGLRIDRSSPIVDARLPDGSRLHAAIPPASPSGPIIAIRRFTQAIGSLEDLLAHDVADDQQIAVLEGMVEDRENFIVSGSTGAGKTTLLNVIGGLVDPSERVVVVEDAAELALPGHVVRLEAQPANAEGAGAVTLSDLVRSALRLRPDRIVLGEVRGEEALDLVGAMNTGHDGSMSTIHANSPEQALLRLETLAISGSRKVPARAIHGQIHGTITHAIQISRRRGIRRLTHVGRIA